MRTAVVAVALLCASMASSSMASSSIASPSIASPSSAPATTATVVAPANDRPCRVVVDVHPHGVDEELARDLAAQGDRDGARIAARLGVPGCPRIDVELVHDMAAARTLDPPWHLPLWAAGAAAPAALHVVVGMTAQRSVQDRARTLRHELGHVLLHEATGGRAVPRWFDEGAARVLAGEHGADDLSLLARAAVADSLLPLEALVDGFPVDADAAALAYAQAGRAVSLLEDKPGAMARIAHTMREGLAFEDALQREYGRASWQLALDVKRSVPRWRALLVVGMETDLAMAACGVLVGIAGARARRRVHARLQALADEEARVPVVDLARWTVRRTA